ncbi:MAG: SPFH domain-containing protein, partial [Spirochaetaceae bacterium]|nr:SPFH domain-containing protein [Spirochaetaceae bacterium]
MGIFDAIKNEIFIDIIEWIEEDNNTIAYRYDRRGNDIRNGAQLTVREGQCAIFVNEGQLADVFTPGMYELETENLPILSRLKGWKYGFKSPFKAEVYFVSTRILADFNWGTPSPFSIRDPEFGILTLRARGHFSFHVIDAGKFIKGIVGTEGEFTKSEIKDRLRQRFVTQAQSAIAGSGKAFYQMAENLHDLSLELKDRLNEKFNSDFGMTLDDTSIQAIEPSEESMAKIESRDSDMFTDSRIDNYERQARVDALKIMAGNPGAGGLAAGGMGMGMGLAMGNQMGHQMGGGMYGMNPAMGMGAAGMGAAAPPPPPQAASWYLSIQGQQAGPIAPQGLMQYAQNGQLTAETMVWKQGMAAWTPARQVAELAQLFGPP